MLGDMLNTREAGRELGVTANRVLRLIYDKRLRATKIGRDWHIHRRDLDAVRHRPNGRPPQSPRGATAAAARRRAAARAPLSVAPGGPRR